MYRIHINKGPETLSGLEFQAKAKLFPKVLKIGVVFALLRLPNQHTMLNQVQTQKQQLKILPQQIHLLNIFHLNTLQLEQRILDELNDNPLLEENLSKDEDLSDKFSKESVQDFMNWDEYGYDDIPDYKLEYENYLPAANMPCKPIAEHDDFREQLKQQYREQFTDDESLATADYIVDSLNDHGILELDLASLAENMSFSTTQWIDEKVLEDTLVKLQSLEPAGIAARNVQECFLLQLRRMNGKRPDVKKAISLLENHFDDLRNGHLEKIESILGIDQDELKIVLQLIASLRTRPIVETDNGLSPTKNIIPDFIITQDGDMLEVALYQSRASSLHINQSWVETVEQAEKNKSADKGTRQYLRSKLLSAQWFISAIQQRETNMLKTMRAIVQYQYEYFRTGDIMLLKPMILKNIAERVNLDISTISRITSNKYAETPFGIVLLKDLFTEGLVNQEGESISNRVIQSTIKDVIEAEDKKQPYTDKQLVEILAARGYNIARRTVAKYREQLQIPVAQQRCIWSGIMQL